MKGVLMGSVVLSVPAGAEYFGVVRTVVAGAAAKASMGIDDIEDIRLAVDEACAHLLALAPDASTLTVRIDQPSEAIEILVSVDAQVAAAAAVGDGSVTWHILSALTDGARLEPVEAGTGIRMRKQALT